MKSYLELARESLEEEWRSRADYSFVEIPFSSPTLHYNVRKESRLQEADISCQYHFAR